MPGLLDHFRAVEEVRPPETWPELGGREPRPRAPAPVGRRRIGLAALAFVVAAAGFVFAVRPFRSPGVPPTHGTRLPSTTQAVSSSSPSPTPLPSPSATTADPV